jgi:hypothetical protein
MAQSCGHLHTAPTVRFERHTLTVYALCIIASLRKMSSISVKISSQVESGLGLF